MIQRILLYFLTALLFLGNVGIPIFKHVCSEDGVFTSLFIPQNNHCQEKPVEELPPCCRVEKSESCDLTQEIINEDDCCHDETTVVQIETDELQNELFKWHLNTVLTDFSKCIFPTFESVNFQLLAQYTPPINGPPKVDSGTARLVFYQVFRV